MAMDKTLSLLVKFAALDRLTAPMRAMSAGSSATAKSIAATRREIAALNRASAQVKGYKDQEARLKAVADRLTTARARVAELTEKMDAAGGSSTRLEKGLAGANRVVADLERQFESQGGELQALSRKLSAAGIDVADLAGGEGKLGERLYDANKALKEQQEQLERTGRARAKMEKMQARGEKLRSTGYSMVAAGAAIGAPLLLAENSASNFQSQMTDIAQKANLTRKEAAAMGQVFDRLGPKIGQLPEKLAEGVDALAGFGLDPKQGVKLAEPIGRAATAYKAEILDLSKAAFSGIDNLKVPVAETGRILDAMAQAGKEGAFEVKDMASFFPTLTASAQALGQKGVPAVADLAAALQITRKGAGDSASAANNLQNLLAKINTKDTIKNFKAFGIDLPNALKKAAADGKTPIEAISELANKAVKGDLSKLSFLFGDMQVQQALRPLIQNIDEYRRIRAAALQANGTVERDFADRMEDAAAKTERMKAQASALGHSVGNILLPVISSAMDKVGAIAERMSGWAQAHPGLTKAIVLTAGGLAVLLTVMGALAIGVGAILGPFAALQFAVTAGIPGLKMFAVAIRFVAMGFLRLGAAMLLNPWGLLIAGIALAAYLIYKNWDSIKAAFTAGVAWLGAKWTQLKGLFNAGLAWLGGLRGQFHQFGANLLQGLADGITSRLAAVKSTILGVANSAKTWFKNALGIHSPSRVFAGFGEFLTKGLEIGVDRGAEGPIDRITRVAKQMASAVAVGAAVPALASPAVARPAAAAVSAAPVQRGPITINIHAAPGQSAEDIAQAVADELDRRERAAEAERRSSYRDDD